LLLLSDRLLNIKLYTRDDDGGWAQGVLFRASVAKNLGRARVYWAMYIRAKVLLLLLEINL